MWASVVAEEVVATAAVVGAAVGLGAAAACVGGAVGAGAFVGAAAVVGCINGAAVGAAVGADGAGVAHAASKEAAEPIMARCKNWRRECGAVTRDLRAKAAAKIHQRGKIASRAGTMP